MDLSAFKNQKGVFILSKIDRIFSEKYLALRKQESRILSDEEVKSLPQVNKLNLNFAEWNVRQKTTNRFINYLNTKSQKLVVLDVGCGNGWFSNKMAGIINAKVIGLDVNSMELEQASQCFQKDNLDFILCDIFANGFTLNQQFDIISLNASVQYFSNFDLLITTLKSFLKPNGEIHILDSPFYNVSEVINARKRTLDYYTKMGHIEMSNYYYHHSKGKIRDFKILYQPKKTIFSKVFSKKDSPFLWLRLINSYNGA